MPLERRAHLARGTISCRVATTRRIVHVCPKEVATLGGGGHCPRSRIPWPMVVASVATAFRFRAPRGNGWTSHGRGQHDVSQTDCLKISRALSPGPHNVNTGFFNIQTHIQYWKLLSGCRACAFARARHLWMLASFKCGCSEFGNSYSFNIWRVTTCIICCN